MMRSPHPPNCSQSSFRCPDLFQRPGRLFRERFRSRPGRYALLTVLTALLCLVLSLFPSPVSSFPGSSLGQGRSLYEAGRYEDAVPVLEQTIEDYQRSRNRVGEAIAQRNLSLVYQALGDWQAAEDAIQSSLDSFRALNQPLLLAQALDAQGHLQFRQGQVESALATWEAAADLYTHSNVDAEDVHTEEDAELQTARLLNGINQAEALQALGFYRQAIARLDTLIDTSQPNLLAPSAPQARALRSLGDALRSVGELERSEALLQESLAIAITLSNPAQQASEQAATHLSLGNTAQAQGNFDAALAHYQQAAQQTAQPSESAPLASPSLTQIQAQLNQVRILSERQDWPALDQQLPPLTDAINALPPSRPTIAARINLARTLKQATPSLTHLFPLAARHLATARQQAHTLGDRRMESFAVGSLGELYETAGQQAEAQPLAEEALKLAQQVNAADIAYLWQWLLGRIHAQQGEREQAIASYQTAIADLQGLRNDLVAINPEVQFSFRESVEPIHRELVSLLLDPTTEPSQMELEQARATIESLQLAELNNFFREACLDAREVQIDEVDQRAAVIYPIILADRLEVIVSLPPAVGSSSGDSGDRILRHMTNSGVTAGEVTTVSSDLLASLKQVALNGRVVPLAEQLYGWLIDPLEAELEARAISTLVFVLDGVLRNIPMAVLYDGDRYLVERYSIALTPSLQLLESSPISPQRLNVLMGGISESHQDFSALPGVVNELVEIQRIVPDSRKLLNQDFTDAALQDAINALPFPVVHLATHGKFSSSLDDTFILTWGDRLNVNELNQLLQATDISRRRPIELLVLSACETADGDDRAALGMAGVAVRAGARSTVATLWQLNDQAAPLLMERLYQALATERETKADALRQAQLALLENPEYQLPYFWAAVVLIGNWL